MRRFVGLLMITLAFSDVASAQTSAPPRPLPADAGYVEAVGQAAFSDVTSQSYGVEAGFAIRRHFQIYADIGFTRDVAPASFSAAAQTIAGGLSQVQSNVGYTAKEPVTFGVGGIRFTVQVAGSRAQPYVKTGFGLAHAKRDATFTVGGADVTANLSQDQYGNIVLGSDLSGSSNEAMFELGGGLALPLFNHLIVDLQVRYERIFADPAGINLTRAGVGIGVRF
jgi:opacity protein-like surface antigen